VLVDEQEARQRWTEMVLFIEVSCAPARSTNGTSGAMTRTTRPARRRGYTDGVASASAADREKHDDDELVVNRSGCTASDVGDY
jgi:hypothetical protein